MHERPGGKALVRELYGAGVLPVLRPRRRDFRSSRRAEIVLDALDREDVGEIGGQLDPEHRLNLVLGRVPDGDCLFEAAADEQLAPHRQPGRPLQVEDRYVRRALLERDRFATFAVDREHRAREKARIRSEEAGRRSDAVQVSTLVADHEGRAIKKRKPHALSVPSAAQATIASPLTRSKK